MKCFSLVKLTSKVSIFILIFAQQTISADLPARCSNRYPIRLAGTWGFVDSVGRISITPQFQGADEFSESLAAVWRLRSDVKKCGYIDVQGNTVIDFAYDFCGRFRNGLAVVKVNSKFGYIQKNGRIAVSAIWDFAGDFSDGLARVGVDGRSRKYGFIDRKGKVIVKPRFPFVFDFSDGLAAVAVDRNGKLKIGYINRKGKVVIRAKYGTAGRFSGGFAPVIEGGYSLLFERDLSYDSNGGTLLGFYINKAGKRAFPGDFKDPEGFSEGLASIMMNDGGSGYIDTTGAMRFETAFEFGGSFSEGLAAVNFAGGGKFIDRTGKVVISTSYGWVGDFNCGLAMVRNIDEVTGTESYGYIDHSGKAVWEPSR